MNMNAEYICDFLVTEEQKKINLVYLELLQEFDRLCREAGLTYWLSYGGLIGAARHKGFIPWDDDIDLMMPRADFDRLQAMTQKDFGVREPYFLQNLTTEPHCLQSLIRFRRSDTSDIRNYDLLYVREHPKAPLYNMGINLAVFPIDVIPDSKKKEALQKKITYLLRGISYRTNEPDPNKLLQHKICATVVRLVGKKRFLRLFHSMYRRYNSAGSDTLQIYDGLYDSPQRFPKSVITETVYLPFEDIAVPAPKGYDDFLTCIYGDYMQLPPIESRIPGHGGHTFADIPYPEAIKNLTDSK